jgi:hypothetical protein
MICDGKDAPGAIAARFMGTSSRLGRAAPPFTPAALARLFSLRRADAIIRRGANGIGLWRYSPNAQSGPRRSPCIEGRPTVYQVISYGLGLLPFLRPGDRETRNHSTSRHNLFYIYGAHPRGHRPPR